MTKAKSLTLEQKRSIKGFMFVLPILIGLIVVYIPSIVQSIYFSFGDIKVNQTGFVVNPVGWDNYFKAFFEDTQWRVVLLNSIKDMLLDVPVIIMFSFFMATLLNQKFHGNKAFKVIFFLPVIIATGIISQSESSNMILGMYNSGAKMDLGAGADVFNYEELKQMLYNSAIPTMAVDFVVGAVDKLYVVITSSGVQLLIFLAGLQSMPVSMFEAAKVEGASGWETFWKISFPYISPLIMLNVIYTIIDSFMSFRNQAVTFIKGAMGAADQYGFACALSWSYVLVVAILLVVVWLLINKLIIYQD